MDQIDFVPVFDIHVSSQDVLDYYIANDVPFEKLKNGFPNMNRNSNKMTHELLLQQKRAAMMTQYNDLIQQKIKEKKQEACMYRVSVAKTETCPICGDDIVGMVVLDCSHLFCIKCMISHFRVNNTCPLCRMEVCDKPKVIVGIPNETISSIMEANLSNQIPARSNQDLYNYILTSVAMSIICKSDPYILTSCIIEEIRSSMMDMSITIRNWYDA